MDRHARFKVRIVAPGTPTEESTPFHQELFYDQKFVNYQIYILFIYNILKQISAVLTVSKSPLVPLISPLVGLDKMEYNTIAQQDVKERDLCLLA